MSQRLPNVLVCKNSGCEITRQALAFAVVGDVQDRAGAEVGHDRDVFVVALGQPLIDAQALHPHTLLAGQAPILGLGHDAVGFVNAVHRDPGSAHGRRTCWTPGSGTSTRGTSASRMVWNWQVASWREWRSRASQRGLAFSHSVQASSGPLAKPMAKLTWPALASRLA